MSDIPYQCASCGAAATCFIGLTPGDAENAIPFCGECKEDGTMHNWLVKEFEEAAKAMGATPRVDEKTGRTLWTLPEDADT